MNNKKLSITKQIVSMTEISKMLQLSRARFYQLLDIGFFPKPLYDDRSKRPYTAFVWVLGLSLGNYQNLNHSIPVVRRSTRRTGSSSQFRILGGTITIRRVAWVMAS